MPRSDRSASPDSLFSEPDGDESQQLASRETPTIPGLWAFPCLLPADVAHETLGALAAQDVFLGGQRDQVMLFAPPPPAASSLPAYAQDLLRHLQAVLEPVLPSDAREVTFNQNLARQVILNLYPPGQGIASHIDLPNRYADGIVGVSLTGGCVMSFTRQHERYDVYLPPRTVYVMTGEARWQWAHGIEERNEDLVEMPGGDAVTLLRDTRVSVTFRWMKQGGEILS